MTLYLWDASDFDWGRGPMDLGAAKADGITGFSHKATEGTSVKHTHTGDALNRARNAGFEFIGAYHVVRSVNVAAQVDYFLSYLDQVAPWWRTFPGFFMQVDLELWSYDQVSAATGKAFASALVAAQPKRVITYASRGQYGNSLTGIITPLWNAAFGSDPAVHYPLAYPGDGSSNWAPYSGWTPVFWQYGSQLRIGTQPTCDCSAYRGSLEELRTLITGTTTPEESMQAVAGDPSTGKFWIGDGMWRREITEVQARSWIAAGAADHGNTADVTTYGRDVAEVQGPGPPGPPGPQGPAGVVPDHTHNVTGTTGPAVG